MRKIFKVLSVALFTTMFFFQSLALGEGSKRVLIFYSSIGMGHLSAARAIESNLKSEDPSVEVRLVNIRDTIPSQRRAKVDEWMFWKVVKTLPSFYDYLFQKNMVAGVNSHQLNTKTPYQGDAVMEIINEFKPTNIVTTHYGATLALIKLREENKLENIPVAWLHTDYFKGYFPRISKNIEMTFLGADALTKSWIEEGLSPQKVVTTGLPVNAKAFEPVDKEKVFAENQLDLNKKTVVLMSGGEGVGDFPAIVSSIARSVKEPVQIVAICGKNEAHVKNLTAMKSRLPEHVTLQIHGFVKDNIKVLDLIKASDVYITKSGGLSPTEGFAINKPMILLDVYGGHERENAKLLGDLGMAIVNQNQMNIGQDVNTLFTDSALVSKMLRSQTEFRNSFNLAAINRFIFSGAKDKKLEPVIDFGLENGPRITNDDKAIAKMNSEFNADIELILSYGKSDSHSLYKGDTNAFGHLAVKIDGQVYTLNGQAQAGTEREFVYVSPLEEYLYGTERKVVNMEHSDAFGNSYSRDNISLRVKGVTTEQKRKMIEFVKTVDERFRAGELKYVRKGFNCADLAKQILESADLIVPAKPRPNTIPLDVLSNYKEYFENDPKFETEMALYTRALGSKNKFHQVTFPLSIYQLKRSVARILFPKSLDPLEKQVTRRIYISTAREAYHETVISKGGAKAPSITKTNTLNNMCLQFYAKAI